MIVKPTVPHAAGFSSTFGPLPDFRVGTGGSEYTLADHDLPQVMALCSRLRQGNRGGWHRPLAVALRRFNQAYARDAPEDRIIDLTIALESTLLFDIREELSYRLPLRGAALLAAFRLPKEVRAVLEALYDVRSLIVHEGKMLTDQRVQKYLRRVTPPVTAAAFPDRCEDVVRAVPKEYVMRLDQQLALKDINAQLESRIIVGLGGGSNPTNVSPHQ